MSLVTCAVTAFEFDILIALFFSRKEIINRMCIYDCNLNIPMKDSEKGYNVAPYKDSVV